MQEKKRQTSYALSTLLMAGLIICASGLHYIVAEKQKILSQIDSAAQRQLVLTQRLAMLASRAQSTPDQTLLEDMKSTAGEALNTQDALKPLFLPVTENQLVNTDDPFFVLSAFIDAAFVYANAPQGDEGRKSAQSIEEQVRKNLPDAWRKKAVGIIDAQRREIDLLVFLSLGLYAAMISLLAYQSIGLVVPALRQLDIQGEELERMAAADALTGYYNRAMLFKVAHMLISSAKRHKSDLAVLAIDIDGLGKINDTHGRAAGDGAIKAVAKALSGVLRNSDAIGRMGGGEFAVFLPSTDEYRASLVAEKLRAAVEEAPCAAKDGVILLRVSIGVCAMLERHKTPDDLLRTAEKALRHAKESGRNKISTWSALQKMQAPA